MFKRIFLIFVLVALLASTLLFGGIRLSRSFIWENIVKDYHVRYEQAIKTYFDQELSQVSSLAKRHGSWSELQKRLGFRDHPWLQENATSYLLAYDFGIDAVGVFNEDLTFSSYAGDEIKEELMASMTFQKALVSNQEGYEVLWVGNRPYLLYGLPVQSDDGAQKTGVYLLGRRLDADGLNSLSSYMGRGDQITISITQEPIYEARQSNKVETIERSYYLENLGFYINVQDEAPLYRKLLNMFQGRFFIFVILLMIGVGSLFLYGVFRIIRQITALADQVNHMAMGTHHEAFPESSFEELETLQSAIHGMSKELSMHIATIDEQYLQMITMMSNAVEMNDDYTQEHNERVADIALKIGKALHYDYLEDLEIAARLHDLGKIAVPSEIINKPGSLTDEEFSLVKKHPVFGYQLMRHVRFFERARFGVLYHHEWVNGQGYPEGLQGDEIPLIARIIAVSDVYDALTSDRPYRSKLSKDQAIEMILEGSGTQFDPQVVEAFIQVSAIIE